MKKLIKPLILVIAAATCGVALAEDVAIPAGQQGNSDVKRPHTGLSMDQVTAKFGAPGEQMPAVGSPPITRWVYDSFTVYFEGDRVIHSVLNAAP